jgi:hypothetical protein
VKSERYRWEIRDKRLESGPALVSIALSHFEFNNTLDLTWAKEHVRDFRIPRRPYRVSYTIDNICKAKEAPKLYGRRVWRTKSGVWRMTK